MGRHLNAAGSLMDDRGSAELLEAEALELPAPPDELASLLLGAISLDRFPETPYTRAATEWANADPAVLSVVANRCEGHGDPSRGRHVDLLRADVHLAGVLDDDRAAGDWPGHEALDNPETARSVPFFEMAKRTTGDFIFAVVGNLESEEATFVAALDGLMASRFLYTPYGRGDFPTPRSSARAG
jgi:hypothetical protein